jgi:DTW domain-containing protein YfiP
VLRHWREKSRDTNSGQLVTDCIAGARVVDMVDESYKNLRAYLPKGNVWLLFPGSVDAAGQVSVPSRQGLPNPLPKTVVVVDGTWAEAQRMAKALSDLPRLLPLGGPRAAERLLAPPQAGAMATAEAIAALIEEVNPNAAACLDEAYAQHVEAQKTGNRVSSNPYKAVIPIVSGIAYVENPIPELVKGSSTPYLRYTRDWEFLAPQSRDRAFEEEVAKTAGVWAQEVRVYRALGSGLHWVGVALWHREEMEDYTELELAVTLQSGKSWSVPENKVLRWLNAPADKPGQHDETGAGGVDFLRWVLAYVEHTIRVLKRVLENSEGPYAPKPHRIVVGWADPKRERAYAWLTRLGFRKVADGGNGSPAYILDIEAPRQNPKKVPDVPVEATVRSERVGTKTRELTPGVHVVAQISRTGKEVWLTHGEQRLFLYLQDDQGRGSLFYQSFAGTGGKAQGFWFPSGGVLADQRGRGVWVIKGNPKTDPGAGREGLLALYEKANDVLPQSDAETDAFVKKATRVDYDDLMYKDEYEIKPTMKILEEGHANALQSKWSSWAYRFWALNALDKTFGKRTFNLPKSNPSQVREFYHATLSGKNNEIVASMIDGIDSSRAQGFGQGAGFYLFAKKDDAVKHARTLVSGDKKIAKEVPVEGQPIIVVVDAPLTPDNYEADYEVSARVFRRFLFENRDWIRDNQTKLGLVFVPASSGTSTISGDYSWPDRISLITGRSTATFSVMAEPPADQVVGMAIRLSTLAQRIAAVSPELMRQFEESLLKTLPAVKYVGPKIQPARIEHLDGTVIWRRASKSNPKDLAGRYIPDRYLAGLPPALQKQRIRELTPRQEQYKRGDFSELPTDSIARKMGLVKQSQYTTEAKKRGIEYRGDLRDMAHRVMAFYGHRATSGEVQQFADALRKSFAKGLAAWKSGGHRPGATAQNWAVARVNSLVVGGKTSWTADKKLFEVLPAAVRAKIESMRQKQNPISVEVRLDKGFPAGYGGAAEGKHTRFLQSEAALARIVEQGREVVPRIKFVIDWDKNAAAKRPRIEKGERGVITLIASAATLQSRADDVEGKPGSGGQVSRDRKVSLYTAHTILHRLGDRIMPRPEDVMFMSLDSPGFVDRRAALVVTARVENAWRLLGEALAVAWNQTGGNAGLSRWLPTVVDTKACREGWVTDGQQAMAELVPYRLLYKKGREHGVKLTSDLPFVPQLEKAFTNYIDACIDQFTGQEVLI